MEKVYERVKVEAMEEMLHKPFNILDKGEIRLIEYMGTDSTIVNAARVSYGEGTTVKRSDQALINYLLRNKHTSPFEMCEIVLYIKLPIYVAAQWIRHRTANINSYSARYSIMKDEFYIPSPDCIRYQDPVNKQSSGTEPLPLDQAAKICDEIENHSKSSYELYTKLMEKGVSREYARMILPQNIYTYWYWKIDLHNLMHFIALRITDHAQYEIREYAKVLLHEIVAKWAPYTYEAFMNHRLGSLNISTVGQKIIRDKTKGKLKEREEYKHGETPVGTAEWKELMDFLHTY